MEQLRVKHNRIKYKLLNDAIESLRTNDSERQLTLLDLGVGRANDVNKWNRLKVTNVIGIDSRQEQLDEAYKRIKNNNNVILYKIDLSLPKSIELVHDTLSLYKFDIVVCFFAAHYFISNLESILSNVQLADDCIFLSTYMNLRSSMFTISEHFENDYIYIKKMPSNQVEVSFKDTPYFDTKNVNIENLIDDANVKYAIGKTFKVAHARPFVDYYENLTIIDNDTLLIELMHSTMYASRQ